APVRLREGAKPSAILREVSGAVCARALTPPREVVSVPDVLKAVGKSFRNADRAEVEVVEVSHPGNGVVTIRISFWIAGDFSPGDWGPTQDLRGQAKALAMLKVWNANTASGAVVPTCVLTDAAGKKFKLLDATPGPAAAGDAGTISSLTLTFQQPR